MVGRKTIYITAAAAAAVVIAGIAAYYASQQQAAVAPIGSNAINPVNNRSISSTPTPFPVDTKQFDLSYGEWTARWWQWLYSIPEDRNPAADETGENCDEGQSGPVWFLAGTFGGLNERNCVIPAGKSLLLSVIGGACTFEEFPNLRTESELRSCAVSINEGVTELMVTIDGQQISEEQLRTYRVQSPSLFDVALPNGNIITGQEGSTQAVSDGYWVFIPPLEPGAHEIHFRGVSVDPTTANINSINNFVTDSEYHIMVVE
jgi:hypothetical protein